jgi:hypothetical protein
MERGHGKLIEETGLSGCSVVSDVEDGDGTRVEMRK